MYVWIAVLLAFGASFCENLIGTLAMDEHLPANDALAVLRVISFVLIICGSVVLARTSEVEPVQELLEEPQLVGAS